jgi:hypothetical protein
VPRSEEGPNNCGHFIFSALDPPSISIRELVIEDPMVELRARRQQFFAMHRYLATRQAAQAAYVIKVQMPEKDQRVVRKC